MKPARVASSVIMAGLVAACSGHPIQTGRTNYVSPRMPVRTLVETPPSAAVPIPPTPELRPGSVAGLEQLRSAGDANAELLAADTPQATTPDMASNDTTAVSGAETAGTVASGATSSTVPSSTASSSTAPSSTTAQSSTAQSSTAASSTAPSTTAMSVTPVQPGVAQAPAADSVTVASNDDDPDHLVGLSEADALRLLGKPKSRADTPPSRIWTYSSLTCDLRLFFYPEIGGTSYRTLTYEIDDRDPTDSNRRSCVGGLLKNHAS
jgi:hypothetical protein